MPCNLYLYVYHTIGHNVAQIHTLGHSKLAYGRKVFANAAGGRLGQQGLTLQHALMLPPA